MIATIERAFGRRRHLRRAPAGALRRAAARLIGTLLIVAAAVAAAWVQAPPPPAAAQDLPAPVVAVIDYQRIMQDARAARSIRDQLEARRRQFQEEIAAEEQRLHQADKELAAQRSVLTTEGFAERRREFEAEVAEVQRLVQQRRRQLDRASSEALDEVKRALIDVVTGMAEERGFNLVLPASEVLFFGRRLDLTDAVMAELDQALPTVKVPEVAPE